MKAKLLCPLLILVLLLCSCGAGRDIETEGTQKPSAPTVTLSVDCSGAISHGILNDERYAKILPADGKLLPETTVGLLEGDTALSVLKRTLKTEKIGPLSATSAGYIKSIGGLPEFACGASSGWLYRVNGIRPSVGAKVYKPHAGDRLEFIYSCEIGDVP